MVAAIYVKWRELFVLGYVVAVFIKCESLGKNNRSVLGETVSAVAEVAKRIDDIHSVVLFHRTKYMRVRTDYKVNAHIGILMAKLNEPVVRNVLFFCAAVEIHYLNVAVFLDFLYYRSYKLVIIGTEQPCADYSELNTAFFNIHGILQIAPCDACCVQRFLSIFLALCTVICGVVVGDSHNVYLTCFQIVGV